MRSQAESTQPKAPNSIAKPRRWALHFVYPPELSAHSVELVAGLVIGREAPGENPDPRFFGVPHATVSRRHATVSLGFGVPFLADLGSSNGTRVNGVEVAGTPAAVTPQSVVRIGDALAICDEAFAETAPSAGAPLMPPGRSPAIVRVRELLSRAAPDRAAVLVTGETGTGKELLAARVHELSGRRGPYLKINCAELSPQLVESQLFGHVRGAFTGAANAHDGLFVAADGGTLFLDEVGELPLDLQAKLLRVLQEGEVRPVGSVQTRKVDVRVVSATNQMLAAKVDAGLFRRDLHARLSFFELALPPLRERRQDIFSFIDILCARFCAERRRPGSIRLQPAVAERILLAEWPDNLRALDRLVHRLLSAEDHPVVGASALCAAMPELCAEPLRPSGAPGSPREATAPPPAPPEPADERSDRPAPTREEFIAAYEASGGSVRALSKQFGRDRRQIYRWLKAFGIER